MKVSWDDEIPNIYIWKNSPNVPNHQPAKYWDVAKDHGLGFVSLCEFLSFIFWDCQGLQSSWIQVSQRHFDETVDLNRSGNRKHTSTFMPQDIVLAMTQAVSSPFFSSPSRWVQN